jgi:hypothetical protein
MRRSLGKRIATLALVALMAAPAFAAPPRDDSPIDRVERAISRFINQITHIFDLTDNITIPK